MVPKAGAGAVRARTCTAPADDIAGRLARPRVAALAAIGCAAGACACDNASLPRTLEAGAAGVQQANASCVGGLAGFLRAAILCEAHHLDLSCRCAPAPGGRAIPPDLWRPGPGLTFKHQDGEHDVV